MTRRTLTPGARLAPTLSGGYRVAGAALIAAGQAGPVAPGTHCEQTNGSVPGGKRIPLVTASRSLNELKRIVRAGDALGHADEAPRIPLL